MSGKSSSTQQQNSTTQTFAEPCGMVTLDRLQVLFALAVKGCSKCSAAFVESGFTVNGVCYKAKLLCANKHVTNWSSSEGISPIRFLFHFLVIIILYLLILSRVSDIHP